MKYLNALILGVGIMHLSNCCPSPSRKSAQSMLLEFIHRNGEEHRVVKSIVTDAEGIRKVERWVERYYREAPDERLGAVFPRGTLLVFESDDMSLRGEPAKLCDLYQILDENTPWIPEEAFRELFSIFRAYGVDYTGPRKTRWLEPRDEQDEYVAVCFDGDGFLSSWTTSMADAQAIVQRHKEVSGHQCGLKSRRLDK